MRIFAAANTSLVNIIIIIIISIIIIINFYPG